MSGKSLRLRLALAAAVSIAVALIVAGLALTALFERHAGRRVEAELDAHLSDLAGNLTVAQDGQLQLNQAPSDPRFELPFSGHYWQIEDDGTQQAQRSRSLWDYVLAIPRSRPDGSIHRYVVPGPIGSSLLVRERHITYPVAEQLREVRLAVAVDRTELIAARRAFAGDLVPSLLLLAAILMLASWLQITIGLRPLEALRRSVMSVRAGERERIEVDEPEELMPLVGEVNSLLDAQDRAIERARRRAADLAHGLKTPLTVMAFDADRLRQKGETALGNEIDELAASMRRHIGRELARARLDTAARQRIAATPLRGVVEGLARTLMRTPKGAQLRWRIEIAETTAAAIPEEDLAELLGNLVDNAAKWAASEVAVQATPDATGIVTVIEDDGPGVAPEQLARLGQRGIRLDTAVEGTGQGLAISRDIVDAYGGRMVLSQRGPHGLRVEVWLRA